MPPKTPRQTTTRILTRGSGRNVRPVQFMRDIVGELQKATWPTRDEAIRLTGIVLAISAAIGAFLSLLDFSFSQLLSAIFRI